MEAFFRKIYWFFIADLLCLIGKKPYKIIKLFYSPFWLNVINNIKNYI